MAFVLIRDSEVDQVYVYNNLTEEARQILTFLVSHVDILSVYSSTQPYDPAIAEEFKRTGEVNEVVVGGE